MKKFATYRRKLENYCKQKDEEYNILLSSSFGASFFKKEHKMFLEDGDKNYKDISCLEKVELYDNFFLEQNGRPNKKRRNLLC